MEESSITHPELRLAMLGMIEGNGHPYSWSAIINGYNPEVMALCPYPTIPAYLGRQPLEDVGIHGARVTHVWTDNPQDAPRVAAASFIEHVVDNPLDVVGKVDAVIIATDDGSDHVRRARPFVEAGLPVFVDKPLATTLPELRQFVQWRRDGCLLLSTSGMRYAPELRADFSGLGELRWITSFTCKTWERYGIHALEAAAPLLRPGFVSVRAQSDCAGDVMQITHRSGVRLTVAALHDAYGSFGAVHLYGTRGEVALKLQDTYRAFRGQLLAFIHMLQSGRETLEFSETVELMSVIIAGIRSREEHGREVPVAEILGEL